MEGRGCGTGDLADPDCGAMARIVGLIDGKLEVAGTGRMAFDDRKVLEQ